MAAKIKSKYTPILENNACPSVLIYPEICIQNTKPKNANSNSRLIQNITEFLGPRLLLNISFSPNDENNIKDNAIANTTKSCIQLSICQK